MSLGYKLFVGWINSASEGNQVNDQTVSDS